MFISFLRTVILYLVIVITLRLMGKRQIGELEPSELVVAILISDLAAVPMQDIGIPLLSGVIPIITLLAMELLSSELSLKSVSFRKFLCGKPVFIIREGIIDQKAMEQNRLTTDELLFCLRQQGILDLSTVQYAILETNGQMTAFLYPQHAPLTPVQQNISPQREDYPITVIDGGRIIQENLTELGIEEDCLTKLLRDHTLSPADVFLMQMTRSGNYKLIKKEP